MRYLRLCLIAYSSLSFISGINANEKDFDPWEYVAEPSRKRWKEKTKVKDPAFYDSNESSEECAYDTPYDPDLIQVPRFQWGGHFYRAILMEHDPECPCQQVDKKKAHWLDPIPNVLDGRETLQIAEIEGHLFIVEVIKHMDSCPCFMKYTQ